MQYHVVFQRDPEAEVWVATSDDIIGFVMEGETVDGLIRRVRLAVHPPRKR